MAVEGLSIVIPVYNEEANIKNVVSNSIFYIRNYLKNFEIIAVNDGSQDTTSARLAEMQILYPELKIFSNKKNKGYGFAVRKGIEYSRKEWVLVMDGDGQIRIEDFQLFWENRKYYDFILGYRKRRNDNLYRVILAKFGNCISNLVLGKQIKDINCGFKLLKKKDLEKITLKSEGNIISFEILYNLFKNNKDRFLQLPVRHYKRKQGKQTGGRFDVIIKILLEGLKVIFWK